MIDRTIVWLFSQSRMVCNAEVVFLAMLGSTAALILVATIFLTGVKRGN